MQWTKSVLLPRCYLAIVALALLAACEGANEKKEYGIVSSYPNLLHVIDVDSLEVVKTIDTQMPGPIMNISVGPGGRIGYVLTNHVGVVAGFDLVSGEKVFHANMSYDNVRVKSPFGMNVNADGSELYVTQMRVRIKPGEYEVLDNRIAVYDTESGLSAQPIRTFEVPRRVYLLMAPDNTDTLYGLGWDLFAFDTHTGEIKETMGIREWEKENLAPPDLFNFVNQYDASGIWAVVYGSQRTDLPETDPEAMHVGLLTFDINKGGDIQFEKFIGGENIIFGATVNPKDHNEVFIVGNEIGRLDRRQAKVTQKVELDHTYYGINISLQGTRLFTYGNSNNLLVYDPDNLQLIKEIHLPGGGDQGGSLFRFFQR